MKCPRCQHENPPQAKGRFRAGFVFVLAALLTGCVVVPAKVKTSQEVAAPLNLEEGRKIAVLFSSHFSPETRADVGRDMVECIERALREGLPGASVVQQEQFYEAVFPGLTSKQVLLRADTLPILVARPEIRQRLDQLGLHYLILVGADVRSVVGGGALLLWPLPLLWMGWGTQVQMTAVLFELSQAERVGAATTQASGGAGWIIVPLGGGTHAAVSSSCEALGSEVVRMIRGGPEGEGR